ncbi:MAG: hypothetical protein WBV59_05390 [Anaerolineae bacterium]
MNEEELSHPANPTRKPDWPAPQVQAPVTVGTVAPGGKVVGVEIGRVENLILEPAAAPEPGDPPYKGLDFYDVADAPLFFGRERLTADLVEAVRGQRQVVAGPRRVDRCAGRGAQGDLRAGQYHRVGDAGALV